MVVITKPLTIAHAKDIVRRDDELTHVEDTPFVNAIRGGKLIQVTWNELTPDEQRQAYCNTFSPCY